MFSSIFYRYYTDCANEIEFINQIYLYILMPHPDTGICRLQKFGFKCSLAMWLKIVAEHYCNHLFSRRVEITENISTDSDRFLPVADSLDPETSSIDSHDIQKVLDMMPNDRYRELIRLRYLEEKTNEETALLLNMNMANYYNKHRLAKEQFCQVLRKEGLA